MHFMGGGALTCRALRYQTSIFFVVDIRAISRRRVALENASLKGHRVAIIAANVNGTSTVGRVVNEGGHNEVDIGFGH